MAHELYTNLEGKTSMAYVGAKPWHGLGQELTPNADLDVWKKEAGMDWVVEQTPSTYDVKLPNGEELTMTYPDRVTLYRSDNYGPLGIVSPEYKIVHPGDVLDFFKDLVEDKGFQLETAGVLFEGRKFWALAKCGDDLVLPGNDVVKPYLLLATSCDGTMSTVAHYTSVRVVCNNTLRMSIGDTGSKATLRIPHSAIFDHKQAKIDLGLAQDVVSQFNQYAGILTGIKIDMATAIDVVAAELKKEWVTKEGAEMNGSEKLASSTALRKIIALYGGEGIGANMTSSRGTAWGLVNAVTEYCDHHAGYVNGDRSRTFERAHLTDRVAFKVAVSNNLLALA